jgi:hypothetical protein
MLSALRRRELGLDVTGKTHESSSEATIERPSRARARVSQRNSHRPIS